ncbi:CPBP family intramembrane glutamic endopeptidase [Arenimonas sp. MALMAid1274]|uniref:CPBP family intramembrane glutamic endopeptidase n=1 Tax=Arenimonas sp. MALMAid1274 TaxID=3411630 RepID=UPI003B9DECC9
MRIRPRLRIGITVFLAYAAWVFAAWKFRAIDYTTVGSESGLMFAVVQPLGVAALALGAFLTYAGWWRATLFEPQRLHRPVLLAVLLAMMLGFIAVVLSSADFGTIAPRHLLLLVVGTLLVGFCEEMVTRGVLVVSLRSGPRSEAWVWFWSSALFGLLHATNAFFGIGAVALLQVVAAFCVGTGLYLLRRFTGTLLVPIVLHALWDFSTLASSQGGGQTHAPLQLGMQLGTYLLCLVLAFIALRHGAGAVPTRDPAGRGRP